MKRNLFILIFTTFLVGLTYAQDANVKVTLHLDDYLCSEEQWVYIRGYKSQISGSETFIFDSTSIAKGQNVVELSYYIPHERQQYILFSKIGPSSFSFVAEPDTEFTIELGVSDGEGGGTKLIKGGSANNEKVLFNQNILEPFRGRISELSARSPVPSDSVEYYNQKIAHAYIEAIKKTSHPDLAEIYFLMLRTHYSSLVGYDKVEELKLFLQNKYHNYTPIQNIDRIPVPAPSKEAERVSARLKEIHAARNYVSPQDTVIGARISLSLPDSENRYISTDSLSAGYVLVEFWASWCAPCRKESPYLKEALSTYGAGFSIYAVSLDVDRFASVEAIRKDGTEDFVHVYGILSGRYPCYAVRRLGARSIPANFLLDKDRRIVAKNLRGEELLQILGELIGKD